MAKKSRRRKNKKRKSRTRTKRGGAERWTREILVPNPDTFDDIGYFYDCKPMPHVGSTNKSKYRENMIITGNRDENELMLPNKWKIIRMDDSEFYDPQLQLVDMRERGSKGYGVGSVDEPKIYVTGVINRWREMMLRQALVARKRRVRKGVVEIGDVCIC